MIKERLLEFSDEEVLADAQSASESESDEEQSEYSDAQPKSKKPRAPFKDTDSEGSVVPDDDDDKGDWGTSRQDYYNADVIETEADALEEEAEARRLQKKQLEGLTDADFGFNEVDWLEAGKTHGEDEGDRGHDGIVRETLPALEITDDLGPEERLKILNARYPEFEPLAKEFIELQSVHTDLSLAAAAAVAVQSHTINTEDSPIKGNSESNKPPVASIKHSALATYLAALSMYFALLTSSVEATDGKRVAMSAAELREHSIMQTLMQCRMLWEKVKDLPVSELTTSSHGDLPKQGVLEREQLSLVDAADEDVEALNETITKRKRSRKSKAQRAAEAAQIEADARRADRINKTEQDLASLSALTAPTKRSVKAVETTVQMNGDDESDFGEQTALTAYEASEKAKKKKTLRFYTSQIAQKANKRDAAGRDAGGDADLPYRERLRDRQARLNAEAENRGKKAKDTKRDALGDESDEEDRKAVKELKEGSENEYYDMVVAQSQKKKADRKALADARLQAAKEGGVIRVVEERGSDGKRAITYAIEKNKGLAPKRKKDVRNPRVKKRKKYEEKKKKLGSIRQIYKGGEGRGGYGGELTGIKKDLVKSVKL